MRKMRGKTKGRFFLWIELFSVLMSVILSIRMLPDNTAAADELLLLPSSVTSFSGHYYAVFDDMQAMGNASWETAERLCNASGGYLAVINSASESDFLYNLMKESGYNAAFFGACLKDGQWHWSNETPFEYSNWSKKANDGSPYALFLAEDESKQWHSSRFGSYGTAYICEWDSGTICRETLAPFPIDKMIHVGQKWYKVFNNGLSHDDAIEFCKAQGGILACIDSEEIQNRLMEELDSNGTKTMYWIGGMDRNGELANTAYWSGKTDFGRWVWATNAEPKPMDYTNWSQGEPVNNSGESIYVVLNLHSERFQKGGWVSESSVGAKYSEKEYYPNYGFICEWPSTCISENGDFPWHDPKWKKSKKSSCIESGLSEYTCQNCGAVLETKTIEKVAHNYQQIRLISSFSFNPIPGLLKYRCEVCNHLKTEFDIIGLGIDGATLVAIIVIIIAYFSAAHEFQEKHPKK